MSMKYSDSFFIKSSKILLGTAYFGDTISQESAFEIMDTFVEMGGTHIDTARLYAGGEAERIVAKWLKSRKPEGVFVSTKGGYPHAQAPDIIRLCEKEIRHDLEESLKALDTDVINFYWLHRDDENRPVEEIITTMNALVKEGKIKHFGASNWTVKRIKEANRYAAEKGLQGFEGSQIRFSPAVMVEGGDDRALVNMDSDSFDFYKTAGLPIAAYASQAKGFFSKMAENGETSLSEKSKKRYYCEENIRRFEIIKKLSSHYGVSVASVTCAALTSINSPDVFAIIGGSRKEQIVDSMKGADTVVKDEELRELLQFNI
jgi:aryl-alcohol dehydrogenase-like predicted oxidoreductase